MMVKKFSSILVTVALLVNVLAMATPSIAQAAGGGPADAQNVSGEWTALKVGGETWYGFRYAGDGSQVFARFSVVPGNGATFSVLTPDEIQQWQHGAALSPIGAGAADSNYGGDLTWSGSFNTPGIYFIKVDQAGGTPANYALTVTGSGVSVLKPVEPEATTKAAVKTAVKTAVVTKAAEKPAAQQAAVAVAAKTGASPAEALTAEGEWATLPAGKEIWYAIPYGADRPQITVRMAVDSSNPANFAMWTPDEMAQGGPAAGIDPVGRGAPDDALGGDLVWSGSFDTPGIYYVTVTGSGTPTGYQLSVQDSEAPDSGGGEEE